MEWKFQSGMPIYNQIVQQLSRRIASGAVSPGEKMPSVRDLALEAGVNPNTMQKALAELERQGILYTERTSGRFVTEDQSVLRGLKSGLAESHVREMFIRLREMGMTEQEIKDMIANWKE